MHVIGGGILAASSDKQDLGNNIILFGLGVQVIFFSVFVIVTALFHIRISRRPTLKAQSSGAPWSKFIGALYTVSALILVRSVFRMAEYAQGHDGSLIKKEAYVYVLDALLMWIVAVVFAFNHPGVVLVEHKMLDSGVDYDHAADTYPMVGWRRE